MATVFDFIVEDDFATGLSIVGVSTVGESAVDSSAVALSVDHRPEPGRSIVGDSCVTARLSDASGVV
jgi:hypothetical protein